MEIECNSVICNNKLYLNEKKNYKFPSKRFYCIPCRKKQYNIRLKCSACFEDFCPEHLTQKYCSNNCKAVLHNRRVYQRGKLYARKTIVCKLCNIEIPPLHNTYRRTICVPCRKAFLERYNKIKIELKDMPNFQKKKNCLLCKKNVLNRLYCSNKCSQIGTSIRKSGP